MDELYQGDDVKKGSRLFVRMIDNYLSDRWVIYEDEKWFLKVEMTYGALQGSRVGPFVWNVMYEDFLLMDLPTRTNVISLADDALVVCAVEDVGILELRQGRPLVGRWVLISLPTQWILSCFSLKVPEITLSHSSH